MEELYLDADGIRYVESCLQKGGRGLCVELLRLPLYQGKAYTFVTTDLGIAQIKEFERGGLMSMNDGQTLLARHAVSVAQSNPNSALVFQDVWGTKPGDRVLKSRRTKLFFNRSEVYYVVEGDKLSLDEVVAAIREMTSFLIVGALFDNSSILGELDSGSFVSDRFIKTVAENTMEIFVNAYDQESFVVWQR